MPRDIDPAVCKLDGVYLYDLDSLQNMARQTLTLRKRESEKCHQLIEHHVQDFQLWVERTQISNFSPNRRPIAGRRKSNLYRAAPANYSAILATAGAEAGATGL